MKIFQFPNKSALSWLGSGFVYMFGNKDFKKRAFLPFVTSLGIWSFGEARRGASKFRKVLGWAGLVVTALVAAHNYHTNRQSPRR